jgi:trans-2,3-dihydro-3-hydroxyanthranilate isomerase
VFDPGSVASSIGLTDGHLVPNVEPQSVSTGTPFLFVALRDGRAVDSAISNRELILRLLEGHRANGVFLFAVAGDDRLYSRMFAPGVLDIVEDPATGSASGPLGAFAVRHGLVPRADRVALVSEQGTKMGRQSFVHIVLGYAGSGDVPSHIEVGGSVRPVVKGTLVAEGT